MMSLHESLLQSHEEVIRIFPVKDLFGDCAFRLKARGGFMVSAFQMGGKIVSLVLIKSLYGRKCNIDLSIFGGKAAVYEINEEDKESKLLTGLEGEFDTEAEKEYFIVGINLYPYINSDEKISDKVKKFEVKPVENNGCKRMYEAQIGRESWF